MNALRSPSLSWGFAVFLLVNFCHVCRVALSMPRFPVALLCSCAQCAPPVGGVLEGSIHEKVDEYTSQSIGLSGISEGRCGFRESPNGDGC
eukprot:7367492-Pyramimonas_sp.AAC.1